MNSVLTGQNRVIRGVINMILKSLPQQLDPDPTVAAKTAQSIKNAFMITRSFEQAGLTQDILFKMSNAERSDIDVNALVAGTQLSDAEKAFIEAKIKAVLATPAAKKRFLGRPEQEITAGNIKSITPITE
ncbi:MAG TPA: hypothetical protein ENI23_12290 [bacterium]|nr:hypothetical protein [bacterium]